MKLKLLVGCSIGIVTALISSYTIHATDSHKAIGTYSLSLESQGDSFPSSNSTNLKPQEKKMNKYTPSNIPSNTINSYTSDNNRLQVYPYADITTIDNLTSYYNQGIKTIIIAFVTGAACQPTFGTTKIDDPTIKNKILSYEQIGGRVIISFGGERGIDVTKGCTSSSKIENIFQETVNLYHPYGLDFDIEGALVADFTAEQLRNNALKGFEHEYPNTQISFTLPVMDTGLDQYSLNILTDASKINLRINIINIMAMDYSKSKCGDLFSYAHHAVINVISQISKFYTHTSSNVHIAITPMIGINDIACEIFTLDNSKNLSKLYHQLHLSYLSYWNLNRDSGCNGTLDNCSNISQEQLEFFRNLNE